MISLDLSALFPGTSAATGGTPLSALRLAEQNKDKGVAAEAKQPDVQRDVAAFRKAVAGAKTVDGLLSDPRVTKVLLTANGLSDQLGYTALAKKALASDPSKADSLVSKLTDTRWKAAASTYQFATAGLSVIQNPKVLDTLANGYAEVKWRESLDATTPGLSNALAWRDKASSVTSAYQVLADSTLRDVVTTALGIPAQIAFQPVETQAKAITSKLDLSRLSDPKYVETISQRYLMAKQAAADTSGATDLFSLATQSRGLVV